MAGFSLLHFQNRELIQNIGNFLYILLIFALVFDPTNSVLHLKNAVFVLLVGFNFLFFKPDLSYLPHVLTMFFVVVICYIFGVAQGSRMDAELVVGSMKAFTPLFLLLWTPYYNVIKLSKGVIVAASVMITILYLFVISSDAIQLAVYFFVREHDHMVMMTTRSYLGLQVFGMYYKSIISFVFIIFYYYYELYNEKRHRKRNLVCCIFITFTFLVSGTRATTLLPFCMIGLVCYRTLLNKKKLKYILLPLVGVFALILVFIIFLLATQEGELSNEVKYAHLVSYAELFNAQPEIMLFGQGPGAFFYSKGFQNWTSQTEWTYLELLRNYGLFALGILAVILLPLFKLIRYRRNEIAAGFLVSYIFFLGIAGTNPLLLSSTGMIVLLMVYSFVHIVEQHPEDAELPGNEFLRKYL